MRVSPSAASFHKTSPTMPSEHTTGQGLFWLCSPQTPPPHPWAPGAGQVLCEHTAGTCQAPQGLVCTPPIGTCAFHTVRLVQSLAWHKPRSLAPGTEERSGSASSFSSFVSSENNGGDFQGTSHILITTLLLPPQFIDTEGETQGGRRQCQNKGQVPGRSGAEDWIRGRWSRDKRAAFSFVCMALSPSHP